MTLSADNKEHWKLLNHIRVIEAESGKEGLVSALKELVIQATHEKEDGDGKKKASSVKPPPVYSSQPTGLAWKAQALVKDLEQMFGITPQRTNSIKEVLTLPFSQQKVLMSALIER